MSPVSRRGFLAAGAAAGAGLVIGFYLPHGKQAVAGAFSPNAYLKITADDKITVVVARSEMGQGVRTSLPMILAEELEADWKDIVIEQAGASTLYGDQTTGGSASVRTSWDPLRKAGAVAREMLLSAAAIEWSVPRSGCKAANGRITHSASGRSLQLRKTDRQSRHLAHPRRRCAENGEGLQHCRQIGSAPRLARESGWHGGLRDRLLVV